MAKIKIDKNKFKYLREDFPEEATEEEIKAEIARLQGLSSYYYNKQWSEKIILNSSYGALASKYFVGFNVDVASSITEMGRNIVKYGAEILNDYFANIWHKDEELHQKLGLKGKPNKIKRIVQRYGDTDSCFISLEDVVKDLEDNDLLPDKYKNDIPKLCLDITELRLNDYIQKKYNEFSSRYNTENLQKFELEVIMYDTIFLAKKKYAGSIAWKEGAGFQEKGEKFKITGIEIVRSSTPKFCRDKLKYLLNYIFQHASNFSVNSFIKEIIKIKEEFKLQPIENISISMSVGDYNKFIIDDKKELTLASSCPIHIRGAGYHNYLVLNSDKYKFKYELLKTGDKIKMYYAKDDFCNVFSYASGQYPYEIAPEIDLELQFEKTIINPINSIIEPFIGLKINSNLIIHNKLF